MIDEDEGEQHTAAGEIRPMLSIKQVLALIPFPRATLYREMEVRRFPPLTRSHLAELPGSTMRLPHGSSAQEGRLRFPSPAFP
jgi:hypothetical protein